METDTKKLSVISSNTHICNIHDNLQDKQVQRSIQSRSMQVLQKRSSSFVNYVKLPLRILRGSSLTCR